MRDHERKTMKLHTLILATTIASLTATAQIKVSHFPADTKLLLHLDMKQLANSKSGELLQGSMDDKSRRKADAFKAISGVDFMKDLDSLYIASSGGKKNTGVIYALGRFDVAKLTAILGGNDSFKSEPFGSRTILSWTDDEKTRHGCFVNPGLAVVSDTMESLKRCLGLIDGQGDSLAAASPFAAIIPAKANRFVSLAAHDVDSFSGDNENPQLQMLKQAKSLVFAVDQAAAGAADLLLTAALSTADTETAQQMGMMMQGIQAMMMMQAAQNPEVAALAQNFKVETQDTKIRLSLKLTEDQLRKQLQEGMKKIGQPRAREGFEAAPGVRVEFEVVPE